MREDLYDKLEREELKIASFPKRVIAYIIDSFIVGILCALVFMGDFYQIPDDPVQFLSVTPQFVLSVYLLNFFYQTFFTFLYGATLGKMVCKIMIIDERILDKPNLIQSAIRAIIRQISDMFFMLGFAWALSNNLFKTWQDYLAKTIVIDVA
ncbi:MULTISPECIES: RDD family protein [unclassified Campylobacter]|uniref:RDD family protein n=1 Tax=unclassified Campylobacter TaxID=2593542 RepID=UPI001237DD0D|nr:MULTISPECIES: RDD family protein [unclassified Campylobacter]KAA6226749.1 RDD family protein [Campylobacter sp. LR196d]KAA6228655.1 RDD family protein [Campylobacter sp. LR185c]KAA6229058.1 RDD family protein [Campylobacter sp. LR286c]KAA6233707.1 RDD family protein [Campylobacter sp. LR264d]KAA8604281.1 RDD family protein [Campylobacter sp. LR185c]